MQRFPGFFLSLALLSGLLTACSQPEQPAVFNWTLQSQAVSSSVDFVELQAMARDVGTMSNDRLMISVHAAGEIVSGPDIFKAVGDGRVQMGNGWPNWWSGQESAWALMNAGPYGFMNLDASMMYFLAGEGTEMANRLSSPHGILWRPAWWAGMEFGLLSPKPITGLADLKGRKVRIGPGVPSEVLAAAAGSYAIPVVPEEIRTALENDELDAVEWTTTNGAWDLGLHDICKYAIVPAIWQPSVLSDFLINQAAYDALPEDLQTILETAIDAYTLRTTMKAKVKDMQALERFRQQGIHISQWPAEDMPKWRSATEEVYATHAANNPMAREVLESKNRFKARFDDYYKVFGAYDAD